VTNANEPILTDLKKLLRRLEKIDPEAQKGARPSSFEPTATNALKLQKAVLDEVKTGYSAGDGLLQLQTRRRDQLRDPGQSADLPVIVKQSLPVASEPDRESGALRVVIIASVTAAIVSALATGFTVYWLNGGAGNLGLLAPTQVAVRQPQTPVKPAEEPTDHSLPAAETADATAAGPLETGDEPQAPVKPAEEPTDHPLTAAETVDATAAGPLETGDGPQAPVKPAEGPTDHSLPAVETADATAAGRLETGDEPQAPAEQPLKPAAKPVDHSLPAAETADATAARTVETSSELQAPERFSAEPSPKPEDLSPLAAAQTAATAAAGALTTTDETHASVLEGLLPEAATEPDAAVSELAPPEPRLATGPQTGPQISAALVQPPRAPPTRFADAAASTTTIGSVTILSAATELAATWSATRAVASEKVASARLPKAPTKEGLNTAAAIDPTGGFAIVSDGDTSATAASAAQSAPVVAVYEAPENALWPKRDLGPAIEDESGAPGTTPDTAPAAAEPVPTEQVTASPDKVALVHPEEAAVSADEAVEFPVKVAGSDQELAGHYLIVSGLKRGARMSSGIELMFDTWRIDIAQLSDLQLVVPAGFARRQHVDIELRRADGTTREKSRLVVVTPGAAAIVADDADDAVDLPAQVRRTVDEGEVQIDNGSLQGARILFKRAAGKGSARAALLLAGSYDPRVIAAYKTATPPSVDIDKARLWYQRAIELGASRASQSLESLPQAGD
jgi:hypothetical protein